MIHDDDEICASAEQDSWQEIAANVRGELLRRSRFVPQMDPMGLKIFTDTCIQARALEVNATIHDLAIAASEQNMLDVLGD